MTAMLFKSFAEYPDAQDALQRAELSISYDGDGINGQVNFALAYPAGTAAKTLIVPVFDADGLQEAGFAYDGLDRVYTLTLTLDQHFADAGIIGAAFQVNAQLAQIKIVLRPRPAGGDWDADHPAFTLIACWKIDATAGQELQIPDPNPGNAPFQVAAGAESSVEMCVSFSAIFPDMDEFGLPNFQIRFELPALGLATTWLPFSWFETTFPGFPPLRLDGLLAWFGKLVEFDWADIIPPAMPDWDLGVSLAVDLPLGIGVKETSLRIRKQDGNLVFDAFAKGFFLTWQGETITKPQGSVDLHYEAGSGKYILTAMLYESQYPATDDTEWTPEKKYGFALPFEVLKLEASVWYLGIGFYFSNHKAQAGDSLGNACFQLILEIGGLTVSTSLAGGQDKGLFRTDMRLVLRDTTVITNTIAEADAPGFLARALKRSDGSNPFAEWQAKKIPANSFAQDLLAPEPPAPSNDYGLTFHDGEFRSGERAFLLWTMNGRRLIKALGHDLLGREPAGEISANEPLTHYGLEFARLEGGSAAQIRLDWRSGTASAKGPDSGAPVSKNEPCVKVDKSPVEFNIPFNSPGTYLDGDFTQAITFDLPAVSLEVARPIDQSIVLRRDADGRGSVSHLLLFPARQPQPKDPVEPLARAHVGFSLKDKNDPAEGREITETSPEDNAVGKPFLTVGLGYAGEGDFAIRTIGWREGQSPRFLQVLRHGALPITSLIPADMPMVPSIDPGCPGPKPVPLPPARFDFEAFETPSFSVEASWRLSVRIVAQNSLFKMFGDGEANPNQKVSFSIQEICIARDDNRVAVIRTELTFRLGSDAEAFEASGDVDFRFDLQDLSLSIADGVTLSLWMNKVDEVPGWTAEASLPVEVDDFEFSQEIPLLGLRMTGLAKRKVNQPAVDALNEDDPHKGKIDVLALSVRDGRFVLSLPPERAIVLRNTDLGRDSLNFWVEEFTLGPGGLDVTASLASSTIRVKGLKNPFILEQALLSIRSSRLDYLSITGSGVLPELLDEAPVKIAIAFKQEGKRIVLDSMSAKLGDKNKPIFSRGTRFKFEIQELDLAFRRAPGGGERHFFFELTGSAQFTPGDNEFTSGLLENLKSVRLDFVRVPLTDEFAEHISLSIELKRPITFQLFGIFRMEIRSIGFHPKFPQFDEPAAALIIGGQAEFADSGDVIRAEIDFHALYIGLPREGSALPQIYCDGLRVDISTDEGFHIGGRVDTYKSDVLDGFAGEGTVQIPGFPELSAGFAFVRVRKEPSDDWKRAWFIAIEAAKIGYPIGGALPIYLRQIGLGFGYRYTLPLIKELEQEQTIEELIKAMLRHVGKHQTLAHIDSWTPETEGRRWTIALEAVLSIGSANSTPFEYNAKAERRIQTLFTQIFAAYRSDFTLVAAAKVWFPVSVDDFFRNVKNMRERPLASGFFAYSAPQKRLLAHVRKNEDPYLGENENEPIPYPLKLALAKSYFEATLLIEPGLLHAEVGWPDRLTFELTVGPMKVGCRGGILMRIEKDLLIYGYYFSAYGELSLGGGVDLGFVGVRVEALVRVQFATRLLISANMRKPLDSNIYGSIGLDIAVRFLVRAWLRLNFKFFKIKINISFSFSLQISVVGEIGWAGNGDLGFRGRAQFVIGVFGRSLAIKIDVGVNKSAVASAYNELHEYMGSILEPGKAPPMPGIDDAGLGLGHQLAAHRLELASSMDVEPQTPEDAFVTAHVAGQNLTTGGETLYFVWIMPGPNGARFYAYTQHKWDEKDPDSPDKKWLPYATIELPEGDEIYLASKGKWDLAKESTKIIYLRPHAEVEVEAEDGTKVEPLTLQQLIAGCYVPVSDTNTKDSESFPRNWPDTYIKLDFPTPIEIDETIYDERVFDTTDVARSPRRLLDTSNAFDRAIMRAIETPAMASASGEETAEDATAKDLNEQALGNQSLMLQGFYDDLNRIARATTFDGIVPVTPDLGGDRPTLFDLGLLMCVKAKEPPAWLARRDEKLVFPTLRFEGEEGEKELYVLKPAIDADLINFIKTPPVVRDAAAYYDEEVIALAWRLDWGGKQPNSGIEIAQGAAIEIDSYLLAYDITVFDLGTKQVLHSATVTPCSILSKQDKQNKKYQRAQPRYGYSVARDEVAPAETLATLNERKIAARVTPISQSGTQGASFSFTLSLTPTVTPLPADNAQLTLSYDASVWSARMSWRQPVLPPVAGVAKTAGWQLILRPLAEVPLGAYPDEAIDTTDRGLMNTTGQALIENDIIVLLESAKKPGGKPFTYTLGDPDPEGSDLPPAEGVFDFTFPVPGASDPTPYFDHSGRRLTKGSELYAAAQGFFNRRSAASRDGRSWRLFVRAVALRSEDSKVGDILPDVPVSGLAPVRLILSASTLRPLPFFEWPTSSLLASAVAHSDIRADAAQIQVPVALEDGETVDFVGKPGRERAVTVTWNAIPSSSKESSAETHEAIASYTVHENDFDGLINFDLPALWKRARPIRRVVPSDPARARQEPASMADTQNWEAQYPVFAHTRAHLNELEVDSTEMGDIWPGTYSWAESELEWPASLNPEERTAMEGDGNFTKLLEVGEAIARRPLHPYLVLLIGVLSEQQDGWSETVQVETAFGAPTTIADPKQWLAANNDSLDPYGWAGLVTLGLAAPLALRDPITGLQLDQGKVVKRLKTARDDLDRRLQLSIGKSNAFVKLASIGHHILIDLPIQHAQAYRAVSDNAGIADVGLTLVQVSLRPLPRRIASYDFIRIARSKPKANPGPASGDFDILFPSADRPAISIKKGQTFDVKRVLKKGDLLLVREVGKSAKRVREMLRKVFILEPLKPQQKLLAETPIAYFALNNLPDNHQQTPFGRFARIPKPEKDEEIVQGMEACYVTWITYLVSAFARPEEGDDAPDSGRKAVQALIEKLKGDEKLFDVYRDWGQRFFATAPIESLVGADGNAVEPGGGDPALDMAAAQPKSVAPLTFAADGQGKMRFTRFIEEEWATARGYSISWEGRYDRLLKAVDDKIAQQEKEVLPKGAGRADIILPRIRTLEPPTILSARIIRATDGRQFHEIVVNHSEQTLSDSNREVAAKLEFGDIRRRYDRIFAEPEYVDNLAAATFDHKKSLLDGASVALAKAVDREEAGRPQTPDLLAHDQTLLYAAPAARWGATRYQDAAEPFYYRQTVTIEATASNRQITQDHEVIMPLGAPDVLVPLDQKYSAAPPAVVEPLSWDWFWTPTGMENVWTEMQKKDRNDRFAVWSRDLSLAEELKEQVVGYMRPSGHKVTARLPRYVESVAETLREVIYPYELQTYRENGKVMATAGLLPDGDVRLLIVDTAPGETVATIAQIVPVRLGSQKQAAKPQPWDNAFRITHVSSDFEGNGGRLITAQNSNWTEGLFASTELRPAFAGAFITIGNLMPLREIEVLVPPRFDTLLKPEELPNSGGLARLTALTIRVVIQPIIARSALTDDTRVDAASPLSAPRWLLRPHLKPSIPEGDVPASETDLAIALRLLLDTQRRCAAALLAWDADGKHGTADTRSHANLVLRKIETAEFVYVLPKGTIVRLSKERLANLAWRGITFWERMIKSEGEYFLEWKPVLNPQKRPVHWTIVLAESYDGKFDISPKFVDELLAEILAEQEGGNKPVSAELILALSSYAAELAGKMHRPTAMRAPKVFAQRGNEPRVPWEKSQP